MAAGPVQWFYPRQSVTTDADSDENVGSTRNQSASASQLVSTLVPTLLIAVAFFALFLILRTRFPRQYAPRTYLGALRKQERTPALPKGFVGWLKALNQIPDTYVLQHNSLDAFFLLRYLKISVIITFVGCLFIWPILFPINATGAGGRQQLDLLTFGNVDPYSNDGYRYYAHALVAWIYIGFIFFMVTREMIFYINLRQAYLLSPLYAERMSSRTVLFQSVPSQYADEARIRKMFGEQLKNVWVASSTKELEEMVEKRTKTAMKLEAAETKLVKLCNQARLKQLKRGNEDIEALRNTDAELGGESGSLAARWISPKQRPTHRLKPLVGQKVDTINWAREEIAKLNPLIEKQQDIYRAGGAEHLNGVFVEFYRQSDAQAAYQMVAHHQPLHMSPRIVGLQPEEVIWKNLGITWKTRTIRNILSIAICVVTIIFWSIPVAVVGSISNINFLATRVPFLSWILDIPSVILGVITGLLPAVALAILMSLLPPFLRFLGKFSGKATLSLVELRCHESYFWFQVVQVFLVTTMTSAASSAVPQVLNGGINQVPTLLAQSLPASSNFYISYFILQGLTFASGALLQIVGLVLFHLLGKILDTTPRKMYNRWSQLSSLGWGTIFPVLELLTVISIAYSAIAPLMMGFATIGLFLFYFAYRYNLLFVNSSMIDTKGLVYAKALKHTLVGCYLSVICLIGLFGVAAGGKGKGPLIMMIALLVFMILYHVSLNAAIDPLLYYLPRSLETEEESLLRPEYTTSMGGRSGHGAAEETAPYEKGYNVWTGVTAKDTTSSNPPPATGFLGMIHKWLRPDIYASYSVMRQLVPRDFAQISYSSEIERDAYQHPAVTNAVPLLWIPRDIMGVSKQECAHTNKVTPVTDDGATFNDKGRVVWSEEETGGRPPIWEDKIYY
ncbi:phosphate metabolism protein 7 [Lithohypha guttulata]|uniref:phosphate metabolism protein 7 n=1 Tax=Lithohypha guttulata TaxID=1690604 RepID=UPI002DDF36A0|nr:phosphate metabolism protein 7 [Lithohypha guttulata]